MKQSGRRQWKAGTLAATLAWMVAPEAAGQFGITRTFNTAEAIPDSGELLTVGSFSVGGAKIAKVGVTLKIDGSPAGSGFNGDLYASLIHASGFSVLLNRPGKNTLTGLGYSDSGLNVELRDGAPDIHSYRQTLFGSDLVPVGGVVSGTWSPDGRAADPTDVVGGDPRSAGLGSFAGLDLAGEWLLFAADLVGGGTHQLDRWGLDVETEGGFTGPVSLGNGDSLRAIGGARSLANAVTFEGIVGLVGTESLTFNGSAALQGSVTLKVDNATSIQGGISASGPGVSLTKTGSGTLTLGGTGTYSGGTVVEQGSLRVVNLTGSATGSGLVSVLSGASFGGTGLVDGPVEIRAGAVLAPGGSGGALRTGPQTWHGGGTYRFEISGASATPGNTWSRVEISGGLTISATASNPFRVEMLSLGPGGGGGAVADFDPSQDYFWPLAITTEGVGGFDAAKFTLDPGTQLGSAAGLFGVELSGSTLGIAYTAIPEPAGAAAAAAGLVVLAAVFRYRKVRGPSGTSAGSGSQVGSGGEVR